MLRGPLRAASWLYGIGVGIRNARYDRDPGRVVSVRVPVISVGNLTAGGTGKTPLVIDLIERLAGMGYKPVVVSRGYRADELGRSDELLLVSRHCPNVPCIAEPDRVAGANRAMSEHRADVVVLDDAFQHRRIGRDLDVVTIDATVPFGYGFLLPRGLLREPVTNLRRAGLVVITRADQVLPDELVVLTDRLRQLAPAASIVASRHRVEGLSGLDGSAQDSRDVDQPLCLVSAIARPAAFERSATDFGLKLAGHARYRDHHAFTAADLAQACAFAKHAGAAAVLVTEKDAVKIAAIDFNWPLPVRVLRIAIDFLDDGAIIVDQMVKRVMAAKL